MQHIGKIKKTKKSITLRLILFAVGLSTLLSILASIADLSYEFKTDQEEVFAEIETIKHFYLSRLAEDMLNLDIIATEKHLESIQALPIVDYSRVDYEGIVVAERGNLESSRTKVEKFNITFGKPEDLHILGHLSLGINNSRVYDRLYSRIVFSLASSFAKNLIIVLLLLALFDRTLTRHIRYISHYLSTRPSIGLAGHEPLALKRDNELEDELTTLASTINQYQRKNYEDERRLDGLLIEIWDNKNRAHRAEKSIETALKTKSRFLGLVSHELMTPLNIILGLSTEADKNNYKSIHSMAKHIATILSSILNLSQHDSDEHTLEKNKLDFAKLSGDLETWLTPKTSGSKSRIKTQLSFPRGEDLEYLGDLVRIQSLLLNALIALTKERPEAPVTLHISVETPTGFDSKSQNGEILAEGVLKASIRADEKRVSALLESTAFEDISTENFSKRKGTGLGIEFSSCMRQLKALNGSYSKKPHPNQSISLIFDIPIEITKRQPKSSSGVLDFSEKNFAVLVVDDALLNRVVLMKMLSSIGIDADQAADGKECLNLCLENKYDIIFMDYHMPNMDGCEATRELLASYQNEFHPPSVIGISADHSREAKDKCQKAGMKKYLYKPIELETIIEIFANHGVENENNNS